MTRAPDDPRPDPDALLAQAKEPEAKGFPRGRLKVFFGAAAGVGKTYAMLSAGRAKAVEGVDVVVGYAEPHARPETESLLLGMELLATLRVEHRGLVLREFDLDAALKRRPDIILVDELAHSNAPGMRHPKRWQDVWELLDAGINVYTTLNVQHLESVNDIVEQITGVRVRETLPDAVLEQADEVELVDLAPEQLLERFNEGKVYQPEQAERAATHFFTKGNLIALRELALRTTAERVDAQMQDFRRVHAVGKPWAASERVLVCVGPSPLSARLVRAAKRLATGLRAPWIAAHVETSATLRQSDRQRQRLEHNLQLAERLGAQIVTLRGENVAEEIAAYARANNVTKIVIGKSQRPWWRDRLFGSIVDDMVRRSGAIDVHVIRGDADDPDTDQRPVRPAWRRDYRGYLSAVLTTAAATLIGWPLYHQLGLANTNILMLYLLGVLWVACRHSRGAAVLASLLGVTSFDVCFVPPYYRLAVTDQQYLLTFAVMLVTALILSTLTARIRAQTDSARQRERRTRVGLALSRELAAARTTEQITDATLRHVHEVINGHGVVLLPDDQSRLTIQTTSDGGPPLDEKELGVADWVFKHGEPAGIGTNTLPASMGHYLPLKTTRGVIGVLGVIPHTGTHLSIEQRQVVENFASQAAIALERAALADEARRAWERVEAEFLRNTLLSGVSHELRTPLTGITGAISTLMEAGPSLADDAKSEMLDTIASEAERMERLINNLLDMTRLEAGGLIVKKEWQPLQDVIGAALHHMDRRLRGRLVTVRIPNDLSLVPIDDVAIEQVLVNLLDNAVQHTPEAGPIDIEARSGDGRVVVEVADRGPGLPTGTERRVFDKFFRAAPSGNRRGIGLGLAICRGIIQLHGGVIAAVPRPGGGTIFQFTLPCQGPPPAIDATR
ncbi:MAG: sensor histidine kinase KdpD [Phycisphaeraceae bacterium]|nr:sensor histidine kinase KdpD [Phycisphaeraceae bacterium]